METRIQEIPVTEIRAGNNDRKNFERVALMELADSIRESGLRPADHGPTD
jgi:ParB-like chromosome segregation protein Spo0J